MKPKDTVDRLLSGLGLNSAAAVSFRNRLINGNFAINQRGAANAPTVYAPGAFIKDRWRAGFEGCTAACAIAANGDTTIFIGSGSLLQDIEVALYLPEGGPYCLSWEGDAVGRVVVSNTSSAFASSSVIIPNLSPQAKVAVEFGCQPGSAPVSLRLAQLEPGLTPTVFERRDDEAARCRRYFRRIAEPPLRGIVCGGNLAARCGMSLSPIMLVPPRAVLIESLLVFDGQSVCRATIILDNYSTSESIELDLALSSELVVGRPAIFFAGQGGILDLDAEAVE